MAVVSLLVSLVSLDVNEDELALVALAAETVLLLSLLSVVPVDAMPLCCAAAWKSAPRNCWSAAASVSLDVDDVLEVELVELDVESVLLVLVDVLEVLSDVMPSEASAEAMAAASGLTLLESDESSDAMGTTPDVEFPLVLSPWAW
jgi:hypothetical protein